MRKHLCTQTAASQRLWRFAVAFESPLRHFSRTHAARSRLAVVRPDLAAEWLVELNDDMDVSKVECSWDYVAWWKCGNCGNNWQAPVSQRAAKADVDGCPQCLTAASIAGLPSHHARDAESSATTSHQNVANSFKSLAETHPQLAARWDFEQNGILKPTDVEATSTVVVWWRSQESREDVEALCAATSDDASSSGLKAAASSPSFQRAVFQFVADSRSPLQRDRDDIAVEQALLEQLSSASLMPSVTANSASPRTHTWTNEAWNAVAADVVEQTKAANALPETQQQKPLRGMPPSSPPRSIEEALRLKALSYYLSQISAGKKGQEFATASFDTIGDFYRQFDAAVGSAPSFIFPDEASAWKKYFTLSSPPAGRRKVTTPLPFYDESAPQVDSESAVPPRSAAPVQAVTTAGDRVLSETQKEPSEQSLPTKTPTTTAYPKVRFTQPPLPHETEAAQPKPRIVRRSRREEPPAASLTPHNRGRDGDGTPESFGKFDKLFDEYEAASLYDGSQNGPAALGGTAVDEVDLVSAVGGLETDFKNKQYQRSGATSESSGESRRPRRSRFELHVPVEEASQPVVVPPIAATASVISQGPRVVARPRRRSQE